MKEVETTGRETALVYATRIDFSGQNLAPVTIRCLFVTFLIQFEDSVSAADGRTRTTSRTILSS